MGQEEMAGVAAWLAAFLPGRALLWEELLWAARDHGWSAAELDIRQHVQRMQQTGLVALVPGVVEQGGAKGAYRCSRCGEEERLTVRLCQSCGRRCATCEACLSMGRCRSCSVLVIGRTAPKPAAGRFASEREASWAPAWAGSLTFFQQQAADMAVRLVRGELLKKELLIHAVTGAGKTEMTFPAMAEALRRGLRVGVVTPRREVVLELAPRLGQAFPHVPTVALYGGAPDRWAMAPLMVMTTHQSLRFRRLFDLLIVDEVDAFPYHHDPMLPRAVAGALADGGRMVYLTATPPEELRERVERGDVAAVTIPERHHGHPLPVPRWEPVGRLREKLLHGLAIPAVTQLLEVVRQSEGRLLVFVPRVSDVMPVVEWWCQQFPEMAPQVAGVHADDPERHEKVAAFRQGRLKVLVTTTILERGVTISRCHVLVLMADAPVFDAAALVQIAGRAGRDAAFPTGEVWFCSEFRTQAMNQAVRDIKAMNRLAEQARSAKGKSGSANRLAKRPQLSPETGHKEVHPSAIGRFHSTRSGGRQHWRTLLHSVLRWVYGERETCVFCGRAAGRGVDWQTGRVSRWVPGVAGAVLCEHCLQELTWLTGDVPLCRRCGRRLGGRDAVLCGDCRQWERSGSALVLNRSVAAYSGPLREQWHAYKYGGRRSLETLWLEMMAYGWRCHRHDVGVSDEIVYVPMHPAVLRERGFNHARVLAEGLAERIGVPVADRLQRVSAAVRQSQRGREERLRLLDGTFQLSEDGATSLAGKRILLIDDIYTTGTTLEACARPLRQAGARQVVSLTLARA